MVNSTVSSNFAKAISFSFDAASSRLYLRPGSIFSAAARYFFPCFFISLSEVQPDFQLPTANCRFGHSSGSKSSLSSQATESRLPYKSAFANRQLLYREPHLPSSSLDRLNGRLNTRSVEIRHFCS